MKLSLGLGLGITVAGVILLVLGISAADSVSSEISNFFTGKPTDKAIWLLVGGAAALVAGVATAGTSMRRTA